MPVAAFLESLSVESIFLMLGTVLLLILLIALHGRNTSAARRLAKVESEARVVRLLKAVEGMTARGAKGRAKPRLTANRPIAKSSAKVVPAARTMRPAYKRPR